MRFPSYLLPGYTAGLCMAHSFRVPASANADTGQSAQTPHTWLRVQPLAQLPYSLSRNPCRPAGLDPRSKSSEHTCSPPSTQQWCVVYHGVPFRLPPFSRFCERYLLFSCGRSGAALPGDTNHPPPGAGSLGLRRADIRPRQEPEPPSRLAAVKLRAAPAYHAECTQWLVVQKVTVRPCEFPLFLRAGHGYATASRMRASMPRATRRGNARSRPQSHRVGRPGGHTACHWASSSSLTVRRPEANCR